MNENTHGLSLEKNLKRDNWERVMKIIDEEIAEGNDWITSGYLFEINEEEYRKDSGIMDCE